jgi:hypothetical protein
VKRTHALSEVAEAHLPDDLANPQRWLVERLNRGELRGVRIGRAWRMRDSDVDYMLRRYSNDQIVDAFEAAPPVESNPPKSVADGLSARSRRRLRSVT